MESNQVLSPHEAGIILAFAGPEEELWLDELVIQSGLELAQARSAVERLKLKGALEQVEERSEVRVKNHVARNLTRSGKRRINRLPEPLNG